ncbi:hypothetical protein [Rhodococcus sp. YH1]|uniref:hypothetical protein n=1 Tax=Rhodococcus sp. YH1 TaxID=89066 RepID=UPI001386749B|nr:hypothetical protein [Rhodococcus sp. YH1]
MTDPTALTRRDLLAQGVTDDRLRAALRTGDLVALKRGVYLRRADDGPLDDTGRHRILARHVGSGLRPGDALSHVSAAVLLGLDVWNADLRRVHVSRTSASGRRVTYLHVHATDWCDGDVVTLDGVRVTSVARTIVDLGRSLPLEEAVVAGDSGLRADASARDRLPAVLAAARHRTGVSRAAAVVDLLDGRSESVGESVSRLRMARFGLPVPALQHEVVARDGRRYRVDFFWESQGVVGEFDGAGKYADRRDLVAEKHREDALRDLGFEVVRWTWADLDRFEVVARRFARAVARRSTR